MKLRYTWTLALVLFSGLCRPARSQAADAAAEAPTAPIEIDKRIFGVLPNYRTADGNVLFQPITARQKYGIGLRDSFDKPVYLLAGFYAGINQLTNSNPSFGQGMKGYGRRYIRSLGDAAVGNLMTEAVVPSLLREDPRYFLHGPNGESVGHRVWYALTRVMVTRTDAGGSRFNFSEFLGNAGAVAISNLYYAESRTTVSNVKRLGLQIGTDAFANVLKELWPDVKARLFRKKADRT